MYSNLEVSVNLAKIYLNSSKVYLRLRKRIIKFWISVIDLLKIRQIFANFKFISAFKYIYEFKMLPF